PRTLEPLVRINYSVGQHDDFLLDLQRIILFANSCANLIDRNIMNLRGTASVCQPCQKIFRIDAANIDSVAFPTLLAPYMAQAPSVVSPSNAANLKTEPFVQAQGEVKTAATSKQSFII